MSDIFISYKREDLVLAKALAMELSELGWTVWWDHDIPAGQDYDEVIVNELSTAKCVIVLWSDRSVNSRNVKDEANVALERKVLLPILIGMDTRPPLGFRMIQGIRWNENDHVDEVEFEELLRQLKRLIGDSPKPKVKSARESNFANASPGKGEKPEEKISKKTEEKTDTTPIQSNRIVIPSANKQEEEIHTISRPYKDFKFTKITPDETYAIIIGIGNYKDGRVPKLNYARSDAKAFYDLLLNPAHVGLKQENVKLLLDEDATLFNLKNIVISWLFQKAKSDSTIFIYFAGHGGLESDKTASEKDGIAKYLLPWDCNCDNLYASALSNTQLQEILSAIVSKRIIFFMDSCYSAGVTGGGARDMGIIEDFSKKIAGTEGRIVIASAKPNQRSWEDDSIKHGIFTYHLLEALKGKADYDNDGYVSISEVYNYLQNNVPDSVRRLSQSIQEPLLTGDLTKDIFLTANASRLKEKSEELIMKRKQLSDIYNDNAISTEIYTQSLLLLNKLDYELNDKEKRLKGNLDSFLNGGLANEIFVDNWEMIIQMQEKANIPPPQQKPDTDKSPSAPAQKNKFCTNCGKIIKPTQLFCTGCGKKVN